MPQRFEASLHAMATIIALSLASYAHAAGPLAVTGGSPVAVGEYLVAIGGCNDCHTEGWNKAPGAIPPAQRLAGVAIGWHGPWGTSYAINLRLLMQRISVEQWLGYVETMQPKPPMPWFNMRAMSETDLKAMYAYIRSLGPAGVATPADLPPDQKPTTPYIEALPQPPKP